MSEFETHHIQTLIRELLEIKENLDQELPLCLAQLEIQTHVELLLSFVQIIHLVCSQAVLGRQAQHFVQSLLRELLHLRR